MVYLDQRGAGRSERPWNEAYSIGLMVDDLERLRRAWGVPRIALVSHSFGTILAMEYAAKYPNHVARVVLAGGVNDVTRAFDIQCERLRRTDPAAHQRALAALAPDSKRACNIRGAFPGAQYERLLETYMFPNRETIAILKAADEANGLRNTGVVGGVLFRQGLLQYRFDGAARLRAPVLIVGGTHDFQSVIELHREFVQTLPNGRLLEYEGAGHFMWVEQPERFARDVSAFLRGR
jgi:proline iminopeptidase